jgi:hypothetical protein
MSNACPFSLLFQLVADRKKWVTTEIIFRLDPCICELR